MKNPRFLRSFAVLVAIASFLCGLASPACAADKADLSVALKTLPLLTNKITGSAVLAVVYDPANAQSKADADALKTALDAGIEAPGGIKITGLMVPLSDVGTKLSQAKLAFITTGSCTDAVSAAAGSSSVLTITTDLECVKTNKSVLGVVSSPSVEIYYSKTAADLAKIGFAQAFTMLAKQF